PASAPAEETAPPSGPVKPAMVVDAAYMPGAPGTVDPVRPAASADRPAPRREWVPGAMVGPGLYYVIGTFSQWNNAKRLAARYGMLAPSVVTATLNSRRVFRVVIGPFGPGEKKDMRALIRRSGIYDAWAVRMKSTKWSVARSTGSARYQVQSIAQLTESFRF
ncbi:MAG: SPOR domain-containing protein, partial [Rhodospirillales bacterium]